MANSARKFETVNTMSPKSPHIIQCPSCSTKFAVSLQTMGENRAPKFHCSRCDHVFAADMPAADVVPMTTDSVTTASEIRRDGRVEPLSSSPESSALRISSTGSSLPVSSLPEFFLPASSPSVVPATEEPTFAANSHLSSNSSDQQNSFDKQFQEYTSGANAPDHFDAKSLDDFDFSIDEDEELIQASFKSTSGQYGEISVAKMEDEPMGYGSLTRASSSPAVHDPLASTVTPKFTRGLLALKSAITPQNGIFVLTAPCIAFLAFGVFIAAVSNYTPSTIASAASVFGEDRVLIAPKDVFLKNTSVKRVALDSGTMVSQITGTIVNQSSVTFKDVEVQGILFDRSNNLIGKQTAKASSNIGKSRLQSLTADMITDLQETSAARNFSLKAGAESPFTAVVVENPTAGEGSPKTFIARVYSGKIR